PNTVRVLQQMLPTLPADVTLVRPSQLLNESLHSNSRPPVAPAKPATPRFQPADLCKPKQPLAPVPATRALTVIAESVNNSPLFNTLKNLF
ncbi:MAG: divergent polysaccharide deacetylase family protein, partial [Pantoea agglomerans]